MMPSSVQSTKPIIKLVITDRAKELASAKIEKFNSFSPDTNIENLIGKKTFFVLSQMNKNKIPLTPDNLCTEMFKTRTNPVFLESETECNNKGYDKEDYNLLKDIVPIFTDVKMQHSGDINNLNYLSFSKNIELIFANGILLKSHTDGESKTSKEYKEELKVRLLPVLKHLAEKAKIENKRISLRTTVPGGGVWAKEGKIDKYQETQGLIFNLFAEVINECLNEINESKLEVTINSSEKITSNLIKQDKKFIHESNYNLLKAQDDDKNQQIVLMIAGDPLAMPGSDVFKSGKDGGTNEKIITYTDIGAKYYGIKNVQQPVKNEKERESLAQDYYNKYQQDKSLPVEYKENNYIIQTFYDMANIQVQPTIKNKIQEEVDKFIETLIDSKVYFDFDETLTAIDTSNIEAKEENLIKIFGSPEQINFVKILFKTLKNKGMQFNICSRQNNKKVIDILNLIECSADTLIAENENSIFKKTEEKTHKIYNINEVEKNNLEKKTIILIDDKINEINSIKEYDNIKGVVPKANAEVEHPFFSLKNIDSIKNDITTSLKTNKIKEKGINNEKDEIKNLQQIVVGQFNNSIKKMKEKRPEFIKNIEIECVNSNPWYTTFKHTRGEKELTHYRLTDKSLKAVVEEYKKQASFKWNNLENNLEILELTNGSNDDFGLMGGVCIENERLISNKINEAKKFDNNTIKFTLIVFKNKNGLLIHVSPLIYGKDKNGQNICFSDLKLRDFSSFSESYEDSDGDIYYDHITFHAHGKRIVNETGYHECAVIGLKVLKNLIKYLPKEFSNEDVKNILESPDIAKMHQGNEFIQRYIKDEEGNKNNIYGKLYKEQQYEKEHQIKHKKYSDVNKFIQKYIGQTENNKLYNIYLDKKTKGFIRGYILKDMAKEFIKESLKDNIINDINYRQELLYNWGSSQVQSGIKDVEGLKKNFIKKYRENLEKDNIFKDEDIKNSADLSKNEIDIIFHKAFNNAMRDYLVDKISETNKKFKQEYYENIYKIRNEQYDNQKAKMLSWILNNTPVQAEKKNENKEEIKLTEEAKQSKIIELPNVEDYLKKVIPDKLKTISFIDQLNYLIFSYKGDFDQNFTQKYDSQKKFFVNDYLEKNNIKKTYNDNLEDFPLENKELIFKALEYFNDSFRKKIEDSITDKEFKQKFSDFKKGLENQDLLYEVKRDQTKEYLLLIQKQKKNITEELNNKKLEKKEESKFKCKEDIYQSIIDKHYKINKKGEQENVSSTIHGARHIAHTHFVGELLLNLYIKHEKSQKHYTAGNLNDSDKEMILVALAFYDSSRIHEGEDRDEVSSALLFLSYVIKNKLCTEEKAINLAFSLANKDAEKKQHNLLHTILSSDSTKLEEFIPKGKKDKLLKIIDIDSLKKVQEFYKNNKLNIQQEDVVKDIATIVIHDADCIDIGRICGNTGFHIERTKYNEIFKNNNTIFNEFDTLRKNFVDFTFIEQKKNHSDQFNFCINNCKEKLQNVMVDINKHNGNKESKLNNEINFPKSKEFSFEDDTFTILKIKDIKKEDIEKFHQTWKDFINDKKNQNKYIIQFKDIENLNTDFSCILNETNYTRLQTLLEKETEPQKRRGIIFHFLQVKYKQERGKFFHSEDIHITEEKFNKLMDKKAQLKTLHDRHKVLKEKINNDFDNTTKEEHDESVKIGEMEKKITFTDEENTISAKFQKFLTENEEISFCTQFKEGKKKVGIRSGRTILVDVDKDIEAAKEKEIYINIHKQSKEYFDLKTNRIENLNFLKGLNGNEQAL